ncbi:thiamine biosynthesis protein ThiS [Chryseobacterium piperi]|uniref:Thiamine biosynthesis protein ThiS n=1 Tax=Chryseobacterium piperi TaxID=558152 RepID=A0A086BIH0_9FLAO|nr:sulfur carrier protein ThiS [Chryseobacterium piperi]ASW75559.1 thiamine biosynthesis protein ThiS [Chryseobacterium piperi]KFF28734.1 thiamine biosynthesis protein ThiS [Chryseobacterium piperi]
MELLINHTRKIFALPPENLEELMNLEAPGKKKGIAVALNNRIVPISSWPDTLLQNNDSILIITATQGG